MTRLPIREESQRRLNEGDPRWKAKAVLRIISTLLAFLAMILFAISVGMTVHWENVWNNGYGNDWTDGMPLAPVLLALLFNPIALFLLIRYRRGKSYHPGFNLAFDLIIWALAFPSIVFSVGDGWFWWWQPVELEIETPAGDLILCDEYNFWSRVCQPEIYTIGKIEIAANTFLALILIIHFSLFVTACIATHKWRKEAKRVRAERRNIELQYHRSPEQHMEHQPPEYSAPPSAPTDDKRVPESEGSSPVSPIGESPGKFA